MSTQIELFRATESKPSHSPGFFERDVQYVLDDLISSGRLFTAEDIRQRLAPSSRELLKTRTGSLGSAIQKRAKRGEIRKIGWTNATHQAANNRVIATWVKV